MSKKEKIILDVDTGHDDEIAILVAARSDKIDLRGITVVAGNQTLPKTVKNTLNVCDFYNRTKKEPIAEVAIDLDKERFWDIVIESLSKY